MRSVSNPNYVKFAKAEMVVAFTRDRGELRTNDHGEFFFRELVDGRFTCVNPDLERRLVDLGYTAHRQAVLRNWLGEAFQIEAGELKIEPRREHLKALRHYARTVLNAYNLDHSPTAVPAREVA
jgi:hypothetical protein